MCCAGPDIELIEGAFLSASFFLIFLSGQNMCRGMLMVRILSQNSVQTSVHFNFVVEL